MKNKKQKMLFCVCAILIIVYICICSLFQDISIVYGGAFIAFELICVFAIGSAIVKISNIGITGLIENIGISYAIGYAVNIILYFLIFPLFGSIGLTIITYTMGILSLIFITKKRKTIFKQSYEKKEIAIVLSFLCIILGFQFFVFAANNMSSNNTGMNSYYIDLFYWASDAVSLSKNFPPINFRGINGGTYYYHYFSAIQVVVASLCTGIKINNFIFGFSFIQSAVLLTFSSYIFYKHILKKYYFIIFAMTLLLFSAGNSTLSWVTNVSHMYTAPFGTDVGFAFGMLTMVFIIKQINVPKFNFRIFVFSLVCFSICTGVKAPIASIILLMIGIVCLYWLFSRKKENVAKAFIYGGIILLIFVILYFGVVNGLPTGTTKTEEFIQYGTGNSILNRPNIQQLHTELVDKYTYVGGQLIFLVYYILLVNPAIYFLFMIICIRNIFKLKSLKIIDISFFVGTIVGVMLTRGLKLIGFSQVYFIFATFPYAIAFALRGLEQLCVFQRNDKKHILYYIVNLASIILLIAGINNFIKDDYFYPQFKSGMYKALSFFNIKKYDDIYLVRQDGEIVYTLLDKNEKYDPYYIVVTSKQNEACNWIQNNTDENITIASNLLNNNIYQYPIGVLAERWLWNDSPEVINQAARGNKNSINQLKKNKIDYLLLDSNSKKKLLSEKLAYNIVYENEEAIIIDLNSIK